MLRDPFSNQPSIPFTLYAMECEGEVDTPQGRYNKMIKNLRRHNGFITETDVIDEALAAGLDILTPEEIEQILLEVGR